jgi:CDP-glucose 4,6-dehydratase
VTSDKCYQSTQDIWGRRESDPLGGYDPYSASKAAAEIVTAAYSHSFFQGTGSSKSNIKVATARAGNVIGGGDWAVDRLIPDIARSLMAGEAAKIRNPKSVRPWQHVLEPVAGYILLAEQLERDKDNNEWSSAWNFGPDPYDLWPVERVANAFCASWGEGSSWQNISELNAPFETSFLHLNTDKTCLKLGWRPRWTTAMAIEKTAKWYRQSVAPGFEANSSCLRDINKYLEI